MKKVIKILVILLSFIASPRLKGQSDCGSQPGGENLEVLGGQYKPQRTDLSDGQPAPEAASLNILIVFCQFPDDEEYSYGEWPLNQPPVFADKLLALNKNSLGNYWDRYNSETQIMSDYYQEISRGQFHVTGQVKHYVFNDIRSRYSSTTQMNNEIYSKLQVDFNNDFRQFDKWRRISAGNFKYEADGNLDMIMMVRKYYPGPAGQIPLDGTDFEIDPIRHIWVRNNPFETGSGTITQGNSSGLLGFSRFFGIAIHEYGHYIWGHNHTSTGIMTSKGGLSINDLFGSPFEKVQAGYINPVVVNFSNVNYTIGDISNRTSNDEMLKIPISSSEYFLIENRRKISKYDVVMLGDTTQLDIMRNTGNYGKGVYIYHGKEFIPGQYPQVQDLECADGLWNWTFATLTTPDWSDTQIMSAYEKSLPTTINNDNIIGFPNNSDGVTGFIWFSKGLRHQQVHTLGTDKIYTNDPGWWTSRELFQDRHDAWNLGYNDIMSPYSNPNSKDWNNNNTGIFIHYTGLSNNDASFKVYKVSTETPESEILEETPPSKPFILSIDEHWNGTTCNPKIIWQQNMEPDMISNGVGEITYKRYHVYKSGNVNGMQYLPQDQQFYPEQKYQLVATVDVNPSNTTGNWIDPNVNMFYCSQLGHQSGFKYPVRYRVQAVDKHGSLSVLSDYKDTYGVNEGNGDPNSDNQSLENVPEAFNIFQNYPNPFNPITNIKYVIPSGEHVKLSIYSMSGELISELVNAYREAGSYIVAFNGSQLSSGAYFYIIEAGNFKAVKRMVLIK